MTRNEATLIRDLELSIKLGRAALANPLQYSVPSLAKQNIEFLLENLEKATAQCRYLGELLDRVA